MASTIIGTSGGDAQQVISGNPWSGSVHPIGGIQFRLAPSASGNIYMGLSGNITLNSGGFFASGGGLLDGMIIRPGDAYFVPKTAFTNSGEYNVFARWDVACSGQARLYYEPGF